MTSCCLGDPDVESMVGTGESVTESVCEIRWERLLKVSVAGPLRSGHGLCENGEGDMGVMRPGGRGVMGELGVKHIEASLSSIWRILWITSPAPEHLSAMSFLERKQRAFPFI